MAAAVVLLALVLSGWQPARRQTDPHLEQRAGEPALVLPAAMEQALRAFDSDFKARRLTDYPPWMWRPGCTPAPDCARPLYRFNRREAPFAVVGDFNGDRILDLVIDGDNRQTGRRLVVLSNRQAFEVSEVEPLIRIPADIESSRTNGGATRDWETGLGAGLSLAKPGTYRTPWEPQALILKTDGFVVSYFEKAADLYYLRNGKWNRFTLSD